MSAALVSAVERGSPHDGPGLRTVVFFKGCPLRCPWCHNPELMRARPELLFQRARCVRCGACAAACPRRLLDLDAPAGADRVDRIRCDGCGRCAAECPGGALRRVGRRMTVDELVASVLRDRAFHRASGGGVTLSGGEPTLRAGFLTALLDRLRGEGVHTAIETCGQFAWERVRPALERVDLVLFDLKLADPAEHRRLLGVGNETILANLRRLLATWPERTVVRIPLVPGYTATEENVRGLAALLAALAPREVVLLPWHPFGLSKARALGRSPDPRLPEAPLAREELERWRALLDRAGAAARQGATGAGRG